MQVENMSRAYFIEGLRAIKETKQNELKETNEELVDYAILEEEINDVDYALACCELDDDDACEGRLNNIFGFTTSGSLYYLVKNYLTKKV